MIYKSNQFDLDDIIKVEKPKKMLSNEVLNSGCKEA